MANFVFNGRNLPNGETLSAPVQQKVTIGLWGPFDTGVVPWTELTVEASPPDGAKVTRSNLPIQGNIRRYEVTGLKPVEVTIEAKSRGATWRTLTLDVKPSGWRFLLPQQQQFVEDLADAGRWWTTKPEYRYPLSAMIACGCSESQHGLSEIYRRTHNPFNLQKPADWKYPQCDTESLGTKNHVGDATVAPASFCIASGSEQKRWLSDAARQWCEWIAHYPRESARDQLLKHASSPKTFAEKLFLVGFADNKEAKTKEFGKVWQVFELGRFD